MKSKLIVKLLFSFLIGATSASLVFFVIIGLSVHNGDVPEKSPIVNSQEPSEEFLSSLKSPDSLSTAINAIEFLHNVNYQEPKEIENYIAVFEAKTHNSRLAMETLAKILTTQLEDKQFKAVNNIDTLLNLFYWADGLNQYKPTNSNNKVLFEVISSYWYSKIAVSLGNMAKTSPKVKYSFKFRYLLQRESENKYYAGISNDNIEKFMIRLLETRIGYVIGRIYLEANYLLLGLIILVLIITCISYMVLGVYVLKYFKVKFRQIENSTMLR